MNKQQKLLLKTVDDLLAKIDEIMDGQVSLYVKEFVAPGIGVGWSLQSPMFPGHAPPHDLIVAQAVVLALDGNLFRMHNELNAPHSLLIDEFRSLAEVFSGLADGLEAYRQVILKPEPPV